MCAKTMTEVGFFFFFQAEDGIRDLTVTGVQTCALPILPAASVEYFAEHGVAFAPGPVDGKKYWAGRTNFPGTLIWQPIFAFAAGAADLGYTTGIWELRKGNEPLSLAFGNYLTVWAKQRNGQWKIALDVG